MNLSIDSNSIVELQSSIHKFDEKMRAGLLLITIQVAGRMEDWAKENAKWINRTGNARKGLKATVDWEDYFNLVVTMSHKVDYGPWLELCYSGNYSILKPAIDRYKDEFIKEWENIITNIKV